ncbi:MAG: ATP-binding protein [Microthrixaceae bacterium]
MDGVDEAAATWPSEGLREARMEFAYEVVSPRVARRFVASTARSWGLGDVGAVAELLVSEVVTNAVEHGASGGVVEVVALPAGLRVAVSDNSDGEPVVCSPDMGEPTGRGLAIVENLSRRWGVVPTAPRGKIVWFELDDDAVW